MRSAVLYGLLFAVIVFLYSFRLSFPGRIYYDEVYHVKTAREHLALKGMTENTHPPFGKLLIAASIKVLGDKPWVWRLSSLFAALGALLVFQRLAKRVLNSEVFGWVATMLFALDGISITQARIAMLNTVMLFFMLLAVFFFVRIFESNRKWDYAGCGISLGLAAGTRWVSMGVLAVLGLLFLRYFQKIKSKKDFAVKTVLFLVLLPIAVYFSTHLIIPFIEGFDWAYIWKYQFNMMNYHSKLTAGHSYGSPWWSWPFMTRPIWYFFERRTGMINGILCIGNPAVVWVIVPAMAYMVWRFLRDRSWACGLIVAGFLSQWLPWAFIGRVKFFHYFHPAVPFVVLGIAMVLRDAWQSGAEKRIAVTAYLVLVVVLFIYWYPLLTGYPITEAYFQNHMWFKSWI